MSALVLLAATGCADEDVRAEEKVPAELKDTCTFMGNVAKTVRAIDSEKQGLPALERLLPRLDALLKDAPSDAKADLTVLVDAARESVDAGVLEPMTTDSVINAGAAIQQKCNLDDDGLTK